MTKAAQLVAPGKFVLVDRPLPTIGDGDALIDVAECGVCGGEIDRWSGAASGPLPAFLGHEVAGTVVSCGRDVTHISAGDRIVGWVPGGGFAQQMVLEAQYLVPVGPVAYPSIAEPLACALNAVELTAPDLADDVVIIGAGYMALLVLMLSTLKGARSITVASRRSDALALALELGATDVVQLGSPSGDAVLALTHQRRADVTYDCTGVQAGLDLAGAVTRMSGTVSIVGFHQGPRTIDFAHWNYQAFRLVNAHFREMDTIMHGIRAGMRLVEAGAIDPRRLRPSTFSLQQIDQAFAAAHEKPAGFVKAIVTAQGGSDVA